MQSSNNNRSLSVGVVVTRDNAFSCPRTGTAQAAKVRSPSRTESIVVSKRDRSSESEIALSTWVLVVGVVSGGLEPNKRFKIEKSIFKLSAHDTSTFSNGLVRKSMTI
ncbi:MAG: Uncharacterised protein [Acidimicrobiaceae bacterium]|nr:MAG: Uncharacterised protein [Acidimicrobiaceae bacterium]